MALPVRQRLRRAQGRDLCGQLGRRAACASPMSLRFARATCRVAADLAWASFPCQDLSLAGAGAGLDGARSGAFWGFCSAMRALVAEGRAPRAIALENVGGVLTSKGGEDFVAICAALQGLGYSFGALTIDAAHFLPQSRPRVFFVAVRRGDAPPVWLVSPGPSAASRLGRAQARRLRSSPGARRRLAVVARARATAREPQARRVPR